MPDFTRYTVSIGYDQRLYKQDITGSMAHVKMLAKQGLISDYDAAQITGGLETIEKEIREEKFPWDSALEDLHMNIESRLHQLIGAAAGRLHTARSRNDQVAVDLRLYVKETILELVKGLRGVQNAMVALGGRHQNVVMPGYTHLQRAQPVLFAHHLLAYLEMFQRDIGRFADCHRRTDVLPLGSGAPSSKSAKLWWRMPSRLTKAMRPTGA